MESSIINILDADVQKKYFERQNVEDFHRVVNDTFESVKYLQDSSIRIWYNVESTEFAMHWHPAIEIIMVLENCYTVECSQETFHLEAGDILLVPAGELHHLIAPLSGSRLIYLFDFEELSRLNGFSYLMPYLASPILINSTTCPQVYREEAGLLEKIFKEYSHDTNLWELKIYSYLLDFFVTYGRFKFVAESDSNSTQAYKQKELIERLNSVFDYIDIHYMEDITLEKAADVAGFSKFHFSRLFKQCSGQNFYDYLCYKRIKATETLLLTPELSITEIALQSGFASLSTFNRTFKRSKGCTPTEYRNMLNKSAHSDITNRLK